MTDEEFDARRWGKGDKVKVINNTSYNTLVGGVYEVEWVDFADRKIMIRLNTGGYHTALHNQIEPV